MPTPDPTVPTRSAGRDDRSPADADTPRETTGSPDEADGDPTRDLRALFVFHVVVWNAVLLLIAVGGMLIGFRGRWDLGTTAIAVAALLAAYGVYRWPDRA